MDELWSVRLMRNTGREIKYTRWKMSKGTNSHYSAFIVEKVLLRRHFVLMMKSRFVSIHLTQAKTVLKCKTLKQLNSTKGATFASLLPLLSFRLLLSF